VQVYAKKKQAQVQKHVTKPVCDKIRGMDKIRGILQFLNHFSAKSIPVNGKRCQILFGIVCID